MILQASKIKEFFLCLEISNIDDFALSAKKSHDIYSLLNLL